MTVYKGYMKIVKRNLGLILMYVVIFAGITVLFQQFSSADPAGSYQAESVRIAVVDEDRGSLAEGLKTYLGQFHEVTAAEHDRRICFTGTWNTSFGSRRIFLKPALWKGRRLTLPRFRDPIRRFM